MAPVKKEYDIAGIALTAGEDYSENSSEVFRRFSYCNLLLVNNLITCLVTLAWPLLLLVTKILKKVSLTNKFLSYASKITTFSLKKINENSEVGLLLISTGTFNQFLNLNQGQYLNRISFYTAIAIVLILLFINVSNYVNLSTSSVKARGGFSEESNPHLVLVEKLDFERRPLAIRRYFFFQ